jgi:hypothetical protein
VAARIIRDQFPGVLTQSGCSPHEPTRKEKQQSLSGLGLATSDIQELITEIQNLQDRYSVKFRGDTRGKHGLVKSFWLFQRQVR